jgi:hypothetical protein
MSDQNQEPAEKPAGEEGAEPSIPLNRAQRRALAAGKGSPGNNALSRSTANGGINRAAVPPAQRIQTRGAGRGK